MLPVRRKSIYIILIQLKIMNKKYVPGIGLNIRQSSKTTSDTPECQKGTPLRRNISEESSEDDTSGVESFEVDPSTVIYPDTD